jgi:hypothetical protein
VSMLLAPAVDGRGWIGGWSPGIGDPTVVGWFTTVAYLATAYTCNAIGRSLVRVGSIARNERRLWRGLAILFVALGINKQLDLQSALTEVGRMLAASEGWYERRQHTQLLFIELVAALALAGAVGLVFLVRRMPLSARVAAAGTTMVLAFVVIRAASFHHIDRLLDTTVFELRWNWLLELGGISIVLGAAVRRLRAVKALGHSAR